MYSQIDSNKRKSVILMMVFIAIIIGLGYVMDMYYGSPGSYSIMWIAVIFSLLMTSVSYFKGDKIALWSGGAKAIEKKDNAYLYNMVENLCITAGTPMPKVYVIEEPAINAFATGRKPELASIAVTRGALEKLENQELEGVLAHELAHIKNYDIRFMTMVVVLVGVIVLMSDIFIRSHWFGGRRSNSKGSAGTILMIVGIVLAILSPIIAEIIKLAISRKREYLADASGSLLTRYPEGLASALEKISKDHEPMKHASKATAHLYIANPLRNKLKTKKPSKFAAVFSTHPPIDERIKLLRGMA